ncbi:MAG: NAD(+) synthase [Methanobrevibacter ruminantium]|uniref:NAD(+) synthase n=1 Tax=Methanobrevibacter ruminantium TaxID=83816 RepID=UPI0026ED49A7|nr:NAD(+) synthase [Methanobrevibacter ruminantium]MDD6049438.1 NAD(+) synthase [Methanobrevibacter ruminantium]MDO5841868.1 NAD(+) synthase [Methanobrevibacter ruminantium]
MKLLFEKNLFLKLYRGDIITKDYEFDALDVKDQCVKWIHDFFEENGKGCNAVVGISGGKDSSVVAALCVEALGRDRVIGVLMPNDVQSDIDFAKLLVNHLGIKHYIINVKDAVNGVLDQMMKSDIEISEQTMINLPPRIRMSVLYAVSQSNNGRVANNCNLSEDWVGYATRYGDGAGDFSPLSNLTVTEVKEIGRSLNLPRELVDKVPTDGLSNQSDEEKLGFTYDVLDKYIRTGEISDKKTKDRIDYLHELNKFKLELMPSFKYE